MNRISWIISSVLYIAFALTYSRASYLAVFIAVLALSYIYKSKKLAIVYILVFILTIILLPRPGGLGTQLEREDTIWSRFNNWKETISVISKNPVFGVGFNAYRFARPDRDLITSESHAGGGADNSFLFVWATAGIGGLLTILLILKTVVTKKLETRNRAIVVSLVVLISISALFANVFFYPWIMEIFFIVLGVIEAETISGN